MSDHDALLLDLDGTLLNSENRVHPSNLDALQREQDLAAAARDVRQVGC